MSQLPLVGVGRFGVLPTPRRRWARTVRFARTAEGSAGPAPASATLRRAAPILVVLFAGPLLGAAFAWFSPMTPLVSARVVIWGCGAMVVLVCGATLAGIAAALLAMYRATCGQRVRPDLRYGPDGR